MRYKSSWPENNSGKLRVFCILVYNALIKKNYLSKPAVLVIGLHLLTYLRTYLSAYLLIDFQAERARKNTEAELSETSQRVTELTSVVSSLTIDRRRFDAELSSARADVEDALRERTEAADRATRLQVCHCLTFVTDNKWNFKIADACRWFFLHFCGFMKH